MRTAESSIFRVKKPVKERIIDYLTLLYLRDREFQSQPNQRIKSAYILARKTYQRLTRQEKSEILKQIEKNDTRR